MKVNISEMGPRVRGNTVKFKTWLPGLEPDDRVLVIGSFCQWKPENSMALTYDEEKEIWAGEIEELENGFYEYAYHIKTSSWDSNLANDPYAKMVGPNNKSAFKIPAEKPARLDLFTRPSLDKLVLYNLELNNFNSNFDGVTRRVFYYLRELGINGVIFSPWVGYSSQHYGQRYPVHYFAPDYRYGTPYDLKVMINQCHNADIAVIMDLDLHAVSTEFGFNQMYSIFENRPMLGRSDDSGEKISLNFNDGFARNFVFDLCYWWLTEYNIDGIRFINTRQYWDNADGKGLAPLVEKLTRKMAKDAEEVYLLADDCGPADIEILNHSYVNGVNNRRLFRHIFRMAENRAMSSEFWRNLDPHQLNFQKENSRNEDVVNNTVLNYIEESQADSLIVKMGIVSGSRDRYGNPIGDRKNHWWKTKPFIITQFLASGIPVVFNGQEIGNNRFVPREGPERFMDHPIGWQFMADFAGKDLFRFHQKLISLRFTFESLSTWNFFHYFTDAERQVLVFKRYLDEESLVVGVNFSNESHDVLMPFPSDGIWQEYLDDYDVLVENREAIVKIPARYGVILFKK
ncbi:MAG: alpha-amylase family glycosyl hydrolase [Vulcanimicrobiota bacterium]